MKINSPTYINIKSWLEGLGLSIVHEDKEEQILCVWLPAGRFFETYIKVGYDDSYIEFCVVTDLIIYESLKLRKEIERVNRKTVFGKFVVAKDKTLLYKYVVLLFGLSERQFEDHLGIVKRALELFFLELKKSWEIYKDPLQEIDLSTMRN